MKKGSKITLSFFLALLVIVVIVNLPIISYTAGACQVNYESPMNYAFPCGLLSPCFGGSNVKTITLSSATLYAGYTAALSANATSSLAFSLNNPGCTARIVSLNLWNVNQTTTIILWDNNSGPMSLSNAIDFNSTQSQGSNVVAEGVVNSFTYYPATAGSAKQILATEYYNYAITFSNGQSVSGVLIAQPAAGISASTTAISCSSSQYTRTSNGTLVTLFSC